MADEVLLPPLCAARSEGPRAASKRKGGLVLPVTSTHKGGALKKVLSALLARGAIEEVPAASEQDDEGAALTLKLTKAGRTAIGAKRKQAPKKQAKKA
jgi:hypothetical protein